MSRDRSEGSRKHMKDHPERREGASAAEERGARPHLNPKAQKTRGIRESEARLQIRELRSRYG